MSGILVTMSLGLVLIALAPPAAAANLWVTENPFTVDDTLPGSENWNAYQLNASAGDKIAYTMTVTTSGGCAMLLMTRGHNPTGQSQYDTRYSMDTCGLTYTNEYPVPGGQGTQWSVVIASTQLTDVNYTLTITVTPAPPINWLLVGGILIVVLVVIVALVAAVVMRRKKRAAAMPPPAAPPYPGATQPGYPAPPPAYPQPPQQPPQYPPPPQGP